MMPSLFFLSVEILIIIIGKLKKRTINISSAATKWRTGGRRRGGNYASEGLLEEDVSSQPLSLQPTSVSYSG
jgi:hypothetical protein